MRAPLAAALLMLAAACQGAPADPWGDQAFSRLSLRQRAAQLLVVPADSAALGRVRTLQVGGVQVAGGALSMTSARVASLQRAAARPLLVVAWLDQGVGGVVAGASELPLPGRLADSAAAALGAEIAAGEARLVGINLARLSGSGLTPDAPRTERDFARAMTEQGVPVLARALWDSGGTSAWDLAALQSGPLGAVRQAVGIEPGWVRLPALGDDSLPLAASARLTAALRRDLGAGIIAADLGAAAGWGRYGAAAPVRALAAGADLLLGVDDPVGAVDSILAAVDGGRLPRARVDSAAWRVFRLKSRLQLGARADSAAGAVARQRIASGAALEEAEGLQRGALRRSGDPAGVLRGCASLAMAARPGAPLAGFVAAVRARRRGAPVIVGDTLRIGPGGHPCLVVAGVDGEWPVVRVERARGDSTSPLPRVIRVAFGGPFPSGTGWLAAAATSSAGQRLAAEALFSGAPIAMAPGGGSGRILQRVPADSAAMSADSLAAIDRAIRAALQEGVFTAAAVAVGRNGRLVKLTGYGETGGQPVSPDSTLFDLASLTKIVGTTSAAMAMVDDESMGLDVPLRRYLPGYRGGGRGDVTLRQLLTHTAGLPAGDDLYGLARSPAAAARRVQRAALRSEPGSAVTYSDFGMILLAEGIEARAGMPLDQLLARRVLGPLSMQQTRYRPSVALQDRIVPTALRSERPYVLDGVVHDGNAFRLGGVAGHAGLFSTAREMSVFAQTVLNGGAYGDRRVWQAATVRAFTTPQRVPGGRALGWDVVAPSSSAGDYFSPHSVGHTGYTGTSLWIDLDRQLFVVLLTNRTYDRGTQAQIYRLRRRVHDLAARAITDQKVGPRAGTAAARELERARRRPAPRRPRRPTRPRRG